MKQLPRVYVIVDNTEWIHRLLPFGMQLVQLRMKDRTMNDLRREVRRAKSLCEEKGAQLVVNDHWRIALDEGCDFVHLGQEDLESADIPALKRAGLGLGISSHSDGELERALTLQPDYIALGPIYPTQLKAMPWAPQGLSRIAQWKR